MESIKIRFLMHSEGLELDSLRSREGRMAGYSRAQTRPAYMLMPDV